jgi:hypothetical protein
LVSSLYGKSHFGSPIPGPASAFLYKRPYASKISVWPTGSDFVLKATILR